MNLGETIRSTHPARIRIGGIAVVVLIVAGAGAFLGASWTQRRAETERIERRLEETRRLHGRLSSTRSALVGEIESLEASIEHPGSWEHPESMNALAAHLARIADRVGLNTQRIEAASGSGSEATGPRRVRAGFTGGYGGIERWLGEVHTRFPDLHVVRLDVSPHDPGARLLRADLRLNWYTPRDPTGAGDSSG